MDSKKHGKLYFGINVIHGACDWSIHSGSPDGPEYTLEQAREAWDAGQVGECSLPFQRLVELNWDMDTLKHLFADDLRSLSGKIESDLEILDDFRKFTLNKRRRDVERN